MSYAAMRAGRSPEEVKLIAVTKTVKIEIIKEAIDGGLRVLGENRVQEARAKIEELSRLSTDNYELTGISWHLVGHLQKNKAKYAVQLFDLIHTIDSVELAEEIDRQAEKRGKIQRVLAQVKLSKEEAKHGVLPKDLMHLLEKIKALGNLKLEGLMTMPPFFEDTEEARPYFKRLLEVRNELEKMGFILPELSMGMSNDFEVAIEEGATMVRIGTALFGERSKG
ncbi:YggS family pyridoxal phosphate-dependent enzyme [Thermodesulfovibrionales bacterium]|nr:YggS family pyridoxal phosphate-dependent enzyme [Thermodesulfovibrionales bacterium]MCL0051265.1 YggS family pyridoxal phosphate-dependent enzyme [Thermodesulfovibrionales bacterium]MCL0085221.1 YggS family pyridoxal phosphate-dependent enzyme [Thermodesulfovibrionales bacterium]